MESISSLNTSSFARYQQGGQSHLRSHGEGNRAAAQYRHRLAQSPAADLPGAAPGERPAPAGNDTLRTSVREAMSYERSERGMLNLRTQEGDVVRLKFMANDSIDMRSEQMSEGDRTSSTFTFEASSSARFQIAVQGDLNAEEQKAIEDVLAQAGEMADALYGQDVQSAFAVASDFQINSEQLAQVNLRMSVQERFSYARETVTSQIEQAQSEQVADAADANTTSAPAASTNRVANTAAQTATAQPATTTAAPNETIQPTAVQTPAPSNPAAFATDDLMAQIDNLASALGSITEFLTQLTESLESFSEQLQSETSQSSFSFSYGFKLQMVSELVSTLDTSKEDEPDANSLAAATIDELAAQVDASLDVAA